MAYKEKAFHKHVMGFMFIAIVITVFQETICIQLGFHCEEAMHGYFLSGCLRGWVFLKCRMSLKIYMSLGKLSLIEKNSIGHHHKL